jgi:hypothetical protein
MLECSRIWLLNITEMGESYFIFNNARKRSIFISGKRNGWNDSVNLIISVDGDCELYLNGRTFWGKVAKTCAWNPRDGGLQYILKVDERIYKFTVLENYKIAIFEETLGSS